MMQPSPNKTDSEETDELLYENQNYDEILFRKFVIKFPEIFENDLNDEDTK